MLNPCKCGKLKDFEIKPLKTGAEYFLLVFTCLRNGCFEEKIEMTENAAKLIMKGRAKFGSRFSRCEMAAIALIFAIAFVQFLIISSYSASTGTKSMQQSMSITTQVIVASNKITENKIVKYYKCLSVDTIIRKAAHMEIFFALGFLLSMLAHKAGREQTRLTLAYGFICGLSACLIDEGHQYFVPGRTASFADVGFDFSGIVLGVCVFIFLWNRWLIYEKG